MRKTWKFRAECSRDAAALLVVDSEGLALKSLEVRPVGTLGVDVEGTLELEAESEEAMEDGVAEMMREVAFLADTHVLVESFKAADEYDGERNGPFAGR